MGVAPRLCDCCLNFTIVGTTRHVYFTGWVLVGSVGGPCLFTKSNWKVLPIKMDDFKLLEFLLDCLLARQQIKGVSTWSNRKPTTNWGTGRFMVYGFTEQKIHVGDIPYICRYIYICTYQTKVALLFFRLFFYQVVPLSKDSKPFFCFQQIYVVYFARLRLWNERWKWFIRSQVVLQSVFIFRWNTRNPNQMRLERNCGWWKLMTYEFGSTNLSKKVLLSVKGSTKF